ncbi:MAG TPA: SusC/RagA family TonB-linked outer membrane protein, partial [Flavitalea sp.]|nr:SusC/RagA family TonB-linked outer membrane protein [Flavitalea sp.]
MAKLLLFAKFISIFLFATSLQANAELNYGTYYPPIEIRGRVVDQEGKPLQGVSVVVKGTQNGTTTDNDGRFSLNVPNANAVLEISSVGFTDKSITVGGQRDFSITLDSDFAGLSDVVVVGYGTEKKANLTGAVSNVTSKVLEGRPITSLGQGLQGTISNLNITPGNGSLGQAANFNIRGNTSINGGSPLILVDGIPMDINLINPNDVDNVTVLKDAASAAIYGARAGYGVILITTKTGKKRGGKPKVSLASFYAINKPTRTIDFIDTKERIDWMNEAYQRVNGRNYFDDITMEAMLAHYYDPSKPSSIIHPATPNVWTGVANEEWEKILQNESYPMQQHTASISGSTDKFTYYTSFSYLNQKGLTKKEFFDEHLNRYNLMANLSYQVADWITVGFKTSVNNSEKRFPPNYPWYGDEFNESKTLYQTWTYSTQPFKDPNGNWSHMESIGNPAQMLVEGGYQTRDIKDVWMTGTVQIRPIKDMTVNFNYSANTKGTNELRYARSFPYYDKDGNVMGSYMSPNRVTRVDYNDKYHVFNAFADYTKTLNNVHAFKFLIGFNQEDARYDYLWGERRNLIIDRIPYMTLASGNAYAYDGTNEYAIRGVFGRVNYVYDDRFLFEFNGRYDGSSKFPEDSRYALFPSASVGWRIDNEKFFAGLKQTINHL